MGSPLTKLRQQQPEQDRWEPQFQPVKRPHIPPIYNLDELRKLCAEYGEAAVLETLWGAATKWLADQPHDADLTNHLDVATLSVAMVREYDRWFQGWPHYPGKLADGPKERPLPRLGLLSPDVREEAIRVANETLADWRSAGKRHLGRAMMQSTYIRLRIHLKEKK